MDTRKQESRKWNRMAWIATASFSAVDKCPEQKPATTWKINRSADTLCIKYFHLRFFSDFELIRDICKVLGFQLKRGQPTKLIVLRFRSKSGMFSKISILTPANDFVSNPNPWNDQNRNEPSHYKKTSLKHFSVMHKFDLIFCAIGPQRYMPYVAFHALRNVLMFPILNNY